MDAGTALQQSSDTTGGVGSLLQQEHTQLAPLEAQAKQTMDQPIPKPDLKKSPDAPQAPSSETPLEWAAAINVLAGIGGARARTGATTALTAFSSGMNALKQAKLDQFSQASTQWKEANQQVLDTNKEQIEAYTAALNDKKLSVSEQMAEIQRIAAEYHNDIMAQLGAARNYDGVARTLDMMQHHTDDLKTKYDQMALQEQKLQQAIDAKTKPTLDDDAISQAVESWYKTGSLNGTGISTRANNPNLVAVQNLMAKTHPDFDLAKAQLQFASQKAQTTSSARTFGNQFTRLTFASNMLDKSIPSMLAAGKNLGITPSTDFNALANVLRSHASDPAYANFRTQVRAVASDYAQFIGRGTGTVHSDEEALKILNDAMGQGSLQGFAQGINAERQNAKSAQQQTQSDIQNQSQPSGNSNGDSGGGWSIEPAQ